MSATKNWFEVDKDGLSKLLERKGKEWVLYELIQNCWDTDAKNVTVKIRPSTDNRGCCWVEVEDDHPEGWKDLTHAWTLYAESEKKGDATKRGRFNLGEKLVLALCKEATIETTKGRVRFDGEGRHLGRLLSARSGSRFTALVKMTAKEMEEVEKAVLRLLCPAGVRTTINGRDIPVRTPERRIEATLPTEIADEEGVLRRSARKTTVEVVHIQQDEVGTIFEMGIPVVESGDKYHYNVQMKIPLNSDRDNVTPSYLRELRTLVLNAMYKELTPEEASSPWARSAMEDEGIEKEAVEAVMTLRFGERRVSTDPNDVEGNKLAVSKGYTLIPPRALSKEEWLNVRKHEAVLPAGQVTPSPKPYGDGNDPLTYLDREKWTPGMVRIVAYAEDLAKELLGCSIQVRIASKVTWPYAATYGPGNLTFNLGRLGHAWFNHGPGQEIDELLIHEFGHHYASDHLSAEYHDALCRLGARLGKLALEKPEFFKKHGRA